MITETLRQSLTFSFIWLTLTALAAVVIARSMRE
jgi:hypothetical protein